MRALRPLAPVIAGLMLLLTYFLVQGATPDAGVHERTLDAMQQLILNDAALQRDVLRARAGLLRNYDPLVHSVENMRDAAAHLGTADHLASGPMQQEILGRIQWSTPRCATRTASSMPSSPAMPFCKTR